MQHKGEAMSKERLRDGKMFALYYESLCKMNEDYNTYCSIEGISKYLYHKLMTLSIRCLIFEMHLLKAENKLIGDTPEQRFDHFEGMTATPEFQAYFHEKYPMLHQQMLLLISNTFRFVKKMCDAFHDDSAAIENEIGIKAGSIQRIIMGEGDTHNNGENVAIVCTDNGKKVVYKPRTVAGEHAFNKLLCWLNEQGVKCRLEGVGLVNRNEYGWQEFVEYKGELSREEAKEYYYKCGIFLGLFHVLGTTDIHYENVIVNGATPVFVDLETLVGVSKNAKCSTVLETNLIPGIRNNIVYDFDYSGMCGRGNVSSKIKTISVINPRTDEMRIENVESIISENKNVVRIHGQIAKMEDFVNDVINGFDDLWEILSTKKRAFIEIVNEIFGEDSLCYRQVLRATQVYGKFLIAATHPDYEKSIEARQNLFGRLLRNVTDEKMIARVCDEIGQMNRGDVPYYTVKYDSRDLWSNGRVVCKDYFTSTVKDCLHYRIDMLNKKNHDIQLSIVKKSLFSAYEEQLARESGREEALDPDIFVENTAKELLDDVIEDEKEAVKFTVSLLDKRFYLSVLNMDLYEGGGLIWFLACYGKRKKNARAYEVAEKLFETAEKAMLLQKDNNVRLSAFSGIGSSIYLAYNLYLLSGEEKYHTSFENYLKTLSELLEKNPLGPEIQNYDYVCGIAGLIIVLCRIYQREKQESVKNVLMNLMEQLTSYAETETISETGIAHGISGIAYALLVMEETFAVTRDDGFYEECFEREYQNFVSNGKNAMTWCRGLAGMLYVRAYAFQKRKDPKYKTQLEKVYSLAKEESSMPTNACLCHGTRGIEETYSEVRKLLGDEGDKWMIDPKKPDVNDWGLNQFEIETFMMGKSGVAYSYLKDQVGSLPSVMALELYEA